MLYQLSYPGIASATVPIWTGERLEQRLWRTRAGFARGFCPRASAFEAGLNLRARYPLAERAGRERHSRRQTSSRGRDRGIGLSRTEKIPRCAAFCKSGMVWVSSWRDCLCESGFQSKCGIGFNPHVAPGSAAQFIKPLRLKPRLDRGVAGYQQGAGIGYSFCPSQ